MAIRYLAGGFSESTGACPSCETTVPRTLAWNGSGVRDIYVCHRCGTYAYGTSPTVPGRPRAPNEPKGLEAVLGPEDMAC